MKLPVIAGSRRKGHTRISSLPAVPGYIFAQPVDGGVWDVGMGLDAIFMVIIFINCTTEVNRGKQICTTLTPITTCSSVSTADRTHRDSQCSYLTWPTQSEFAGNQTGDKKCHGNVECLCDQDG